MSEHESSASEEEKDVPSDSALREAYSHIRDAYEILRREATRLRKEREAFDSVAKKLKDVHFGTNVKLNVGGHYFTTSVHTLSKDSGSMLHAMFSGRFDTKPAEDGSYVIDHDGTHFRFILNYLRTGQLLLPDDKLIKRELLAEAQFYQIQGIVEQLEPKPFLGSTILTETTQRKAIATWLPEDDQLRLGEIKLLYRATLNGWSSSDFHKRCDNKGATVIVVKGGTNIFGGYTEKSWSSGSGTWLKCNQAFLFSLENTSKKGAVKLPLHPGKEDRAISCNGSSGPVFGDGPDLNIVSNPNSNNCGSSLDKTYELPPNCSGTTFLAGQQNFTINELEVFGFQEKLKMANAVIVWAAEIVC